jgi:hypothetical protein
MYYNELLKKSKNKNMPTLILKSRISTEKYNYPQLVNLILWIAIMVTFLNDLIGSSIRYSN